MKVFVFWKWVTVFNKQNKLQYGYQNQSRPTLEYKAAPAITAEAVWPEYSSKHWVKRDKWTCPQWHTHGSISGTLPLIGPAHCPSASDWLTPMTCWSTQRRDNSIYEPCGNMKITCSNNSHGRLIMSSSTEVRSLHQLWIQCHYRSILISLYSE